ncbi:hypothetical protein J4476_06330 [Candidatus Woesearchaeota archaeon]|nr:MAG: hypothetical protein QT09_C0012G0026 [archaeon GW2011_AR18]MBS3162286.1 hypothetical protein [Candidatus Woesearchaeota archaeon]HIH25417.1 hypothetical protein [Nanoarchaeota archaeon]
MEDYLIRLVINRLDSNPGKSLCSVTKNDIAGILDAERVYCSGIPYGLSVVDNDKTVFREGGDAFPLIPVEFNFRSFTFQDFRADLTLYFNANRDSLIRLAESVRNSSPVYVGGNFHSFSKKDEVNLEDIAENVRIERFDELVQPYLIVNALLIGKDLYFDPEVFV